MLQSVSWILADFTWLERMVSSVESCDAINNFQEWRGQLRLISPWAAVLMDPPNR